jgi:hypothetical protein
MSLETTIPWDLRKWVTFGSGVGIEIGAADLEVVAARIRPGGVHVLGRRVISNFAARPAAEWGAEYTKFLKSLGAGHLSATVLLPRRDVIVRHLSLPGVAGKDTESAIRFQLDSLHPYGDDEVAWGSSALGFGAVLVGVARRETVDRYYQLFNEAGIAVAAFTFSAAAVHAALRLNGPMAAEGFLALSRSASGAVEVYGESPSRPIFSAEFDMPPQRAASLAASELRLPPGTAARPLEALLPKPASNPVENDLSRNALPYATALAGACPRLAPAANVLPAEHRRYSSRAMFIPTLILASLAILAVVSIIAFSQYAERRYLRKLNAEIASLEPRAQRTAALDRQISQSRTRAELLDQFRGRTRNDLEALHELTRLIEPPAWTNSIDLTRDNVRVTGEAPQAAALLRIFDSSPFFENSSADMIQRSSTFNGEMFQIRSSREFRK